MFHLILAMLVSTSNVSEHYHAPRSVYSIASPHVEKTRGRSRHGSCCRSSSSSYSSYSSRSYTVTRSAPSVSSAASAAQTTTNRSISMPSNVQSVNVQRATAPVPDSQRQTATVTKTSTSTSTTSTVNGVPVQTTIKRDTSRVVGNISPGVLNTIPVSQRKYVISGTVTPQTRYLYHSQAWGMHPGYHYGYFPGYGWGYGPGSGFVEGMLVGSMMAQPQVVYVQPQNPVVYQQPQQAPQNLIVTFFKFVFLFIGLAVIAFLILVAFKVYNVRGL